MDEKFDFPPGYSPSRLNLGNLSRRQLLAVLAAGGGAALLSACAPGSTSTVESTPPATFEGYSIFDETMVDMAWPEIKQAAEAGAIVLLPVGIIEEHGPHMGLAPDIYSTYNWAKLARRALIAKGTPAVIAPPMYWGMSPMVRNYPGTFSVSDVTLKSLIYDIHASLNEWGFQYVFSFNGHGDSTHNRIYQQAVQYASDDLGIGAYYVYPYGTSVLEARCAVILKKLPLLESVQQHLDIHAGAYETATMAAYFPKTANTTLAKSLKPTTEFAPLGYWGDPASYDLIKREDLDKMVDGIITATVEAIQAIIQKS